MRSFIFNSTTTPVLVSLGSARPPTPTFWQRVKHVFRPPRHDNAYTVMIGPGGAYETPPFVGKARIEVELNEITVVIKSHKAA